MFDEKKLSQCPLTPFLGAFNRISRCTTDRDCLIAMVIVLITWPNVNQTMSMTAELNPSTDWECIWELLKRIIFVAVVFWSNYYFQDQEWIMVKINGSLFKFSIIPSVYFSCVFVSLLYPLYTTFFPFPNTGLTHVDQRNGGSLSTLHRGVTLLQLTGKFWIGLGTKTTWLSLGNDLGLGLK